MIRKTFEHLRSIFIFCRFVGQYLGSRTKNGCIRGIRFSSRRHSPAQINVAVLHFYMASKGDYVYPTLFTYLGFRFGNLCPHPSGIGPGIP